MAAKIEPLHKDKHGKLKVSPVSDFSYLAKEHIMPLVVHEFPQAASEFPIVFIKNGETGQFMVVAMMGVKPEENLFVEKKKWTGLYIPGVLSNDPFRLIQNDQDSKQLLIGIDTNSHLVGEKKGNALFDDKGGETAYMEQRKKNMGQYFEHSQITRGFIALMVELDLLVSRTLTLEIGEEKINLNGMYFVDEEKLNALTDEQYTDLRKRGFLQCIYAHLISLSQIRRLARIKVQQK